MRDEQVAYAATNQETDGDGPDLHRYRLTIGAVRLDPHVIAPARSPSGSSRLESAWKSCFG
jgi:hypothetical protein